MMILRHLSLMALLIFSHSLVAMQALERKQAQVSTEQQSSPTRGLRDHALNFDLSQLDTAPFITAIKGAIDLINTEAIAPNAALETIQTENMAIGLENARIEQQNKGKTSDFIPKKRYVSIPPDIKQTKITFYPTDPHLTLAYIGYLDDNRPDYQSIMLLVGIAIQNAISTWKKECTELKFTTGNILWPPFGATELIWLALEVKPVSEKITASLLSLLNSIQANLQEVQGKLNGNGFTDKLGYQKNFALYRTLNDVGLHVSLGRLYPAYAVYNNGQEDKSAAVFLTGLDETKVNEILDVKDYTEHIKTGTGFKLKQTILEGKKIASQKFMLTHFDWTAKSSDRTIQSKGSFSLSCK